MSLLAGLGFREGYSGAVEQEFERLLSALRESWLTDCMQPGMCVRWPDSTIPVGWALANGQFVSRVDNPVLWAMAQRNLSVFSTGNGSTTFGVPDYSATGTYIIRLG